MSKKFKVLVSVLVAVVLLTVSGTAVAMAQDEPDADPQLEVKGLLVGIAERLGITQEQLVAAFDQVRQEMREDCQATDNCTIRQNNENRFQERWAQERGETGRRFQGGRIENQETKRFRISEAVRGRQQIAGPRGWQGSLPPELAD